MSLAKNTANVYANNKDRRRLQKLVRCHEVSDTALTMCVGWKTLGLFSSLSREMLNFLGSYNTQLNATINQYGMKISLDNNFLTTIFFFRIKNVSPLGTLFTILYRSKKVT